jgi:hypothetical protein
MAAKLMLPKLAFVFLPALIMLPILISSTVVQADSCVTISRIGFDKQAPFSAGEEIKFGLSVSDSCPGFNVAFIQCKVDGELWDSGYVTINSDESLVLWSHQAWTAKPGNHTLTFIVDDSTMTRRFFVNAND